MKLSTKGKYGLRAMVDLAVFGENGPVSIQEIAKRQDISDKYLEQLLGTLKKAGLVKSIRGQQGGYLVAEDPKNISVGDVLRALEGGLKVVDCQGFEEGGTCKVAKSCVTKYVWKKLCDSVEDTVDHISLEELRLQSKAALAKSPQNASEQKI